MSITNNGWHAHRWLLWLLMIIPVLVCTIILTCLRRRRNKVQVTQPYDNNQYYQPQETSGYYNDPYNANASPQNVEYQQYETNPQQGYTQGYSRPDGPPPAHLKTEN